MKNIYLILLCLSMCWACQTEEDTQIINDLDALSRSSELTSNLRRLTQNPTTFDDFIDGSSKIRLELPVQLTINDNINFNLENEEDYQSLIQLLETTPAQDNIVLNFPLNVSTINYREETLNSDAELEDFLQTSTSSTEVNCIDLIYPVGVNFFDASNAFVDAQIFNNEAQLFNFLEDVERNNLFYEFQFPLGVFVDIDPDQQFETLISSNQDLISIYNELPESCFNPLLYENNASGTNPTDLELFRDFITDGIFQVSFLVDEGEIIDDYEGLSFNFTAGDNFDGNIFVEQETAGTWSAFLDNGVIVFELDFDSSFYGELDDDWDVISFDQTDLQLQDVSSDGDTSTLVFSKVD